MQIFYLCKPLPKGDSSIKGHEVNIHHEKRILPYTPAQLYALVMDIARYPEFLPWCVGARITEKHSDFLLADMVVGYKLIREKFTSRVHFISEQAVQVEYLDGPLKQLKNKWQFAPAEGYPLHCTLTFDLAFEFRTSLLQKLAESFFQEALHRMVDAFESRAATIYGKNL